MVRRAGWTGLAWLIAMAAVGCGDDDDVQLQPPTFGTDAGSRRDAGPRTPFDGGPLDAGSALVELGLPGDQLVSELTADETQELCGKLDEVIGLTNQLNRACLVEAYLLSWEADVCESIVEQCVDNGATMFRLELELPCSRMGTVLDGCDAPLGDVLACAVQLGEFYEQRVCEDASLNYDLPTCPRDLSKICPPLFGPPG